MTAVMAPYNHRPCAIASFLVCQLFFLCAVCLEGAPRGRQKATTANFTIQPGNTARLTLETGRNYTILVNATGKWQNDTYSGFVFQLHTQQDDITLANTSPCDNVECKITGKNIGMVQLWTSESSTFLFYANTACPGNCSLTQKMPVLVAAVTIPVYDPIPGGCSLTSMLETDPHISINFTGSSTTVSFQDSDVGYSPLVDKTVPECADSRKYVTQLEYHVYHKYLAVQDFSTGRLFDAITTMMNPTEEGKSAAFLKYSDPKQIIFDSNPEQGVVYNVIAVDKMRLTRTAYVPAVTYACNFHSNTSSCHTKFQAANAVVGVVVGLSGLFLCFLGHRFFHLEVVIFPILIFSYVWFLILSVATSWNHTAHLLASPALALPTAALLFLLWFFTGWYHLIAILFGSAMGFLLTATLLYTPLGAVTSVFEISYVYALSLLCGTIICMLPLVAFPRALNIWCCAVIGSYAVIFSIGMFTYTSLMDIILRVVKNASIPGFLKAHVDCQLLPIDIALVCVWFVLLVAGVVIQAVLSKRRERKYYRQQRELGFHTRSSYQDFPECPYTRLRQYLQWRKVLKGSAGESKPLLSPSAINRARYPSQ